MSAIRSSGIDILTYHSISSHSGPTNIRADIFRDHMQALADSDYQVVSLAECGRWCRSEKELPDRSVVITFDDGFKDFVTDAFEELHSRGWTATVFVPTGKLGGNNDWERFSQRQLMTWGDVRQLHSCGVQFGAHTVNHPDLTNVSRRIASQEIAESKSELEQQLGCEVKHFAPPYGRINDDVRREISKSYELSVGTTLARAVRSSDVYDLPRIDMHYFRDLRRWREYLSGKARFYMSVRKLLRSVRSLASTRRISGRDRFRPGQAK